MRSRIERCALAALAALALTTSCERHAPGHPARSVAELALNFERLGRVELSVLHEELRAPAELGARVLAARSGLEVELAGPAAEARPLAARLVVGTFDQPEVAELLALLGVVESPRDAGALLYQGVVLRGAGDAITASFQDPRRPGLPVALIAGGNVPTLAPLLGDLCFPARPAARVHSAGERQVELLLGLDGAAREDTLRDLVAARRAAQGDLRPLELEDGSLAARWDPRIPLRRALGYVTEVASARAALASWLGPDVALPDVGLLLTTEPEDVLAIAGRVDLAAPAGFTGKVVALLSPDLPDDGGAAAAGETLLAALGPPAEAWLLDGAACDAAGTWWDRPLRAALEGLGKDVPAPRELVDPAAVDRWSVHVLAPARGMLFRLLRERHGAEWARAAWRGEGAPLELDALEADFRAYLRRPPRERAPLPPLLAGGFLEGLAIDSRLAPGGALAGPGLEQGLSAAVALGAEALSFTSYALARPAPPFAPGGRLPRGLESVEGDAALACAISAARRRGVRAIALQPHVVAEESGGYWAWRRRTNAVDWDEFFGRFEPLLVHYALLAQLTGCELLCIGTDIVPPTERTGIDQDVRDHFASLWSGAIAKARAVYDGALTYSARWPEEAHVVPFWAELDAIGFTCYPDFSVAPPPRGARALDVLVFLLERRLDEMASFAEERGKPALVMELGFRSTRDATHEAELGPGPLDLEAQRRAYEALALTLPAARERLAGLFVWKWSLDPLTEPDVARGFTPRHKPAEAVLRGMYRD